MLQNDRFLDYDRWFVCLQCGRESVPYEDEDIEDMICSSCADEFCGRCGEELVGSCECDYLIGVYGG